MKELSAESTVMSWKHVARNGREGMEEKNQRRLKGKTNGSYPSENRCLETSA